MEEESNQALPDGELFGQYKVVRMLGEGGMGQVYEVEHQVLETRHAIKLINPAVLEYEESLQYFRNEARVMANLNHIGIVDVDDFGQTEGYYWLRLELIPGIEFEQKNLISLDRYIESRPELLHEFEVHNFLKQTLSAIGYAHSKGVIHCDLKPANILLHPNGAKIADFGIVRLLREDFHRTSVQPIIQETQYNHSLTLSPTETAIMGTYEYMSPEQRKGLRVDGRSDLYAIGLIAYQMLTGHNLPSLKPATEIRKKIHHAWDQWLQKALEENPVDRFRTAQDMLTSLPNVKTPSKFSIEPGQPFIQSQQAPPPADSLGPQQVPESNSSSPIKIILLVLLLGALAASGYYFISKLADDSNEKPSDEDPSTTLPEIPAPPNTHTINNNPPPPNTNLNNPPPIEPPLLPPPSRINIPNTTSNGNNITTPPPPTPPKEVRVTPPPPTPVPTPTPTPNPPIPPQTFSLGPEPGKSWIIPKLQIQLIWIPSGSFMMGSPNSEPQRSTQEGPQHRVELTKGFWMSATEVTVGQWNKLTPESPLRGKDNLPTHSISWLNALSFCNKVEARQRKIPPGYHFRLPTEAEWEYACRGGTSTPYYFGTDLRNVEDHIWYGKNANGVSQPVGTKPPNPFGLFNMHGNVREWCYDIYSETYPSSRQVDPIGPKTGILHVTRGGSWRLFEPYCRSAARKGERNSTHALDLGFRLALAPEINQ